MKPGFWICILVFSLGAFIIGLPDGGPPIIDISELHGPSLIDLIGIAIMVVPWTYLIVYSLIKWRRVLFELGRPVAALSLAAAFAGLTMTAVSVGRDGPYWWMGALTAFAGQLAWIVSALRK